MKKNINYKTSLILLALLAMIFTACNKDDQQVEHAMEVVISGYNASGNALQVAIDTTAYDQQAANGKFIIKPASIFEFSAVYTYYPNQQQRMVVLTDTVTKKQVFSKTLPASGTKAGFNFLFIDGKEVDVPAPVSDTATNKLSFYIRYLASDAPFDMFLYKKDTTGKEDRLYLAKDVKPNTWIQVNYTANAAFGDKNILRNGARIYFTKAGTTDQWAFDDDEGKSNLSTFGMALPVTKEKGVVQAYFLLPGVREMEKARLFFYPGRVW